MSGRSFIDRAAEERRQCLVVGGVVLFRPRLVGGLERVEHGVHRLVGIGDLALPLHRIDIIHVGLVGLLIVAEHAHFGSLRLLCLTRFLHANRYPLRSKTLCYSTTFGTRKKWLTVSGAFLTTSSAISPSLTTSGRFFISIGVTEVIGSTPSTFTSESCSTKASMAFSSPCRWGTSASVTAIRARCAMRRTVAASTDINIGLKRGNRTRRIAEAAFAPQQPGNAVQGLFRTRLFAKKAFRRGRPAAPGDQIVPQGRSQDFERIAGRRNHFGPAA